MDNIRKNYYKKLFLVAALYDFILGFIFLFFYKPIFRILEISIPADPSPLSLSAAFVFTLGFAYYLIYKNIEGNFDLVKVGIFYKFTYVLISFYYFIFGSVPHMIFVVFGLLDAVFLILFLEFFIYIIKNGRQKNG